MQPKFYIFNYDSSQSSDDEMTWGGGDITVSVQFGEYSSGTINGMYQNDDVDYKQLIIIPHQRVTTSPHIIYSDLSAMTGFMRTHAIRFKFYDGTNTEISDWCPIDYLEKPIILFKLEDTSSSIGITAWCEGV